MQKIILVALLVAGLVFSPALAQTEPTGVAVIGDSVSHEYRCVPRGNSTSFNWVEILARKRAVNFGALNGNCYEYDFAWSGNTITYNMASMVTWALEEYDAGSTSKVIIMLGYNDISAGGNSFALYNTYGTQVDRLLTRYASENILVAGVPWGDCASQEAAVTNFNSQLSSLAASKGIVYAPWTDYCALLASYAGGNASANSYNYGGQSVARYNWCHVNCLRLPNDGHPGTISQAVIANAMIADFLGVSPVTDAEVLSMMGIGSASTPTRTPTRTPTVVVPPTITRTATATFTPTPIFFSCPVGMHWIAVDARTIECESN